MVGPPPTRITPEVVSDTCRGGEAKFKRMFGEDWAAHRIIGFVVGPSDDNKKVGIAFNRADGGSTCVSFDADLLPEFAGCLAIAWQHVSDGTLLAGPPKGMA